MVGEKARPGCETTYREILPRILAGEQLDEEAEKAWDAATISAHETLGAPRVGIDREATEWFLQLNRHGQPKPPLWERLRIWRQGPAPPTEEEAKLLKAAHGYYVLELLPPCDGFPVYSHAGDYGLDRTSFRGKFLESCTDVIGEDLLASAWNPKLPKELEAYGQELMKCADAWEEKMDCPGVRNQREPPDELEGPEPKLHIVFAAARWCLFWSQRGHFLIPWF